MNGINSKDRFSFAKGYRARTIFLIFDILLLGILMCMMVLPLLKVIVDSIDPTSYGVRLWPRKIDFSAYEMILTTSSLYRPFFGLCAHHRCRYRYRPVHHHDGCLCPDPERYARPCSDGPHGSVHHMFSGGMIPTYLTIKNLGLMNNMLAVIIPCSVSAYNTILMRSFFASIPNELFESATIDGCSPFGCFWRIMLPLSKPALASVGLFIAVGLWNEYMHFILYITDPNWQNFQVKVRSLILEDGLSGTAITLSADMLKSATVVVVVLPFLFIYPFIQKYFTKGVTLGAVKG